MVLRHFAIHNIISSVSSYTFLMAPIDNVYTKEEVNMLVQAAVTEAKEMDAELMRKHNRNATIISMILGLICLALFLDGLLRILGIVPPFMDLDVGIIDEIVERVEEDVMPQVQKYQHYIPGL